MTARRRPTPSLHGEYLAGEDGTIWRRGRYERGAVTLARELDAMRRKLDTEGK